jgi:hypothetical protein
MAKNKIKITLPGVAAPVEIDTDNFATEDSLRELIKLMNPRTAANPRTKADRDAAAAARDAAGSVDDFGDQIDLTSDQIDGAGSKLSDVFDGIGGKISKYSIEAIDSFQSIASAGDEQSGKLSATVETIAGVARRILDAMSDMIGSIPIIGGFGAAAIGATKVLLEVGSAVAGFVTGMLEALRDQQRQLFDSGVYFAKGIDDAADLARENGTTIGVLGKAAESAKDSLRLFAGGAAAGLKKTTQAFGKLDKDGTNRLLYALGYTQDEILSSMADYGAAAAQAGKNLSTDELAASTLEYLKNQKELSRLTGTDIKEAKARQEALGRETAFQSMLAGMGPEAAASLKSMIASLPESQAELAKARILGMQVTDPALAYLDANMNAFGATFSQVGEMARAGTLTEANSRDMLVKANEAAAAETTRIRDSLGGPAMLGQLTQAGGTIGDIVTKLGQINADATRIAEAGGIAAETFNLDQVAEEMKTNASSLNASIATFTEIETSIASAMQGAAVEMTKQAMSFAENLPVLMGQMAEKLGVQTAQSANASIAELTAALKSAEEDMWLLSDSVTSSKYKGLTDAQLEEAGIKRSRTRNRGGIVDEYSMRSQGGPVARGSEYLVGEGGHPEIFQPSTDGRIISTASAVPVKMTEIAVFRDIAGKLDLLNMLNRAMLTAMESNNRLTRQGNMLAS